MATELGQLMAAMNSLHQRLPHKYAENILGQSWWSKQREAAIAITRHNRVFIQASHAIGKSHLCGGLANWHYDCFSPSITITTAPNQSQVKDILWAEIRTQRGERGGNNHLKPAACRMEDPANPKHWAAGFTARDGTSFHGRHTEHMLFIFDEACGIRGEFFSATEGMMVGPNRKWIAICNPTDPSSRAYQETLTGEWYVMQISALDHPNVIASLAGEEIPYPNAVSIQYVDRAFRNWCEMIDISDMKAGDLKWSLPDKDGKRDFDNPMAFRPGPEMEIRVLGRWPSTATGSVWSDATWAAAERRAEDGYKPLEDGLVYNRPAQIGCDVAWGGQDYTTIIGQRGGAALTYVTGNGWRAPKIAEKLKAEASRLVDQRTAYMRGCNTLNWVGEEPKRVQIVVDHDATGDAVKSSMGGWNIVSQSGMSPALQDDMYPNRRSEVWFWVAERAENFHIDLSRLPLDARVRMRSQAMGPKWEVTPQGRRVEDKVKTRKTLKRSPDDMDALNLAICPPVGVNMRLNLRVSPGGEMTTDSGIILVHNAGSRRSPLTQLRDSEDSREAESLRSLGMQTRKSNARSKRLM